MLSTREENRLWSSVSVADCWQWSASKDVYGYGRFWLKGKYRRAHRTVWETLVGPIPAGLHLDHVCRNRACVNPDHLEPVTCKVNLARSPIAARGGAGGSAANARKTHCPQKHEYTPENTSMHGGRRHCRTCNRARCRDRSARLRAA